MYIGIPILDFLVFGHIIAPILLFLKYYGVIDNKWYQVVILIAVCYIYDVVMWNVLKNSAVSNDQGDEDDDDDDTLL